MYLAVTYLSHAAPLQGMSTAAEERRDDDEEAEQLPSVGAYEERVNETFDDAEQREQALTSYRHLKQGGLTARDVKRLDTVGKQLGGEYTNLGAIARRGQDEE